MSVYQIEDWAAHYSLPSTGPKSRPATAACKEAGRASNYACVLLDQQPPLQHDKVYTSGSNVQI
jgi:hypothetical protein